MSLKIKISILAICFALVAAVCIGFVFAAPSETITMNGNVSYEVPKPVVTASPNNTSLGSVTGGGSFDFGETVTLTATPSGSTFLAWATSTNPNTMEILSTATSYSFELTEDSPTTYYALFNQTTSTSQTAGDLVYTFYNEAKLAEITGMDSSFQGGDYTIPSVVPGGENSYKVYSIGDFAFDYCSSLTSITIPEGVTSIGSYAFRKCSNLTTISIPEGVTSIGYSAFSDCSSLTSITIPEGVTSIGDFAFYVCSSLTSITIPEGVTSIGEHAFHGCSKLTSITLPSTLTSIGGWAFFGCSNLTSITLPSTLTSIGRAAFYGCSSLTSVSLPSTLTSIGLEAFSDCSNLTEITINGNISTLLEPNTFPGCANLTKLTLGSNVTTLPGNLFTDFNLTNLTEIVVLGDLKSTTFPSGTWYKGGVKVTSFDGEGTYTKS